MITQPDLQHGFCLAFLLPQAPSLIQCPQNVCQGCRNLLSPQRSHELAHPDSMHAISFAGINCPPPCFSCPQFYAHPSMPEAVSSLTRTLTHLGRTKQNFLCFSAADCSDLCVSTRLWAGLRYSPCFLSNH